MIYKFPAHVIKEKVLVWPASQHLNRVGIASGAQRNQLVEGVDRSVCEVIDNLLKVLCTQKNLLGHKSTTSQINIGSRCIGSVRVTSTQCQEHQVVMNIRITHYFGILIQRSQLNNIFTCHFPFLILQSVHLPTRATWGLYRLLLKGLCLIRLQTCFHIRL